MARKNSQKFIGRNRAPRVQIEYDVEVYGSEKKVEIPFVMGVMADLSGDSRDALPPVDERKFLTIDDRPIAVFNIKGEFFGLLNRCPHQGAALCEGPLIGLAQSSDPGEIEYTRLGEIIRCPWHGWEFDVRTGQSYCDPKRFRAKAYPVNVEPGASVVKGPYVAETIAVSVESDYVVVDL